MKKLFFGLATMLFFCFVANDVNAQVDTLNRNNGNSGQLKMPADTSRQDTSNMVKPVPRPSTPTRPNPSPGSNPRPEPLPPNVPDSPMPNMPMNPPPVPTTGAPIG